MAPYFDPLVAVKGVLKMCSQHQVHLGVMKHTATWVEKNRQEAHQPKAGGCGTVQLGWH